MSCGKAQEFLEANGWTVAEEVDARKAPLGRAEALALARAAEQVVVTHHNQLYIWDLEAGHVVKFTNIWWEKDGMRKVATINYPGGRAIDRDASFEKLLGPTKNLRAPTFRHGKSLVVGFSEAAYRQALGA